MRFTHFCVTSLVAILTLTQSADSTQVNQQEQDHLQITFPNVLAESEAVTQPPKKNAKKPAKAPAKKAPAKKKQKKHRLEETGSSSEEEEEVEAKSPAKAPAKKKAAKPVKKEKQVDLIKDWK